MKRIAGVFAGLAMAVALVAAPSYIPTTAVSAAIEVKIEGTAVARVGELVKLVATGPADRYVWATEAVSEVCGNNLFFSAERPGTYVFFLVGITAEDTAKVQHTIVVGTPKPEPVVPDPPKPVDPVIPVPPQPPVAKTLADSVAEWTLEVKSPLRITEAQKLAVIYATMPTITKDGQELVDAIRNATDRALGPSAPFWVDWREKLRVEVNKRKTTSFASICNEVADGLQRGGK